MTSAQWDIEIDNMIYYLTEMTEEGCSEINEYKKEFYDILWGKDVATEEHEEISKKFYDREEQIYKYRNKMKEKAFKLISKNYWNLWD